MVKKYELNEKDIDSMIRYLKIVDPDNATPRYGNCLFRKLTDKRKRTWA
jgi:hypothetical protein